MRSTDADKKSVVRAFEAARAPTSQAAALVSEPELQAIVKAAKANPNFDAGMKKVLADEFQSSEATPAAREAYARLADEHGLRKMRVGGGRGPVATRINAVAAVPTVLDVKNPPSITGVLNNGVLTTADNTQIRCLQSPHVSQGNIYRGFSDSVAFDGGQITVRGWPAADGALVVEEYAPGNDAAFVQGGIETVNNAVGVRVRPDKWVKIEDADLAAQLAGTDTQAIILHGPVVRNGDEWTFTGKPDNYWLIGGYFAASANATTNTTHTFQMHHGHSHPTSLATAGLTPPSTGRVYAYGAFDPTVKNGAEAKLTIVKFSPRDAGGFNGTGGGQAGVASQEFLSKCAAWAAKS
jgi:hypothetical protein